MLDYKHPNTPWLDVKATKGEVVRGSIYVGLMLLTGSYWIVPALVIEGGVALHGHIKGKKQC